METEPSSIHAGRTPLRVLVIDDHADSLELLGRILEHFGCEALTCTDPGRCVELATTFQPSIVLLDLAMPACNGFTVAEGLKAARLAPYRLVALTGHAEMAMQERCRVAGFDDFVAKPIELPRLQKLIDAAGGLRPVVEATPATS